MTRMTFGCTDHGKRNTIFVADVATGLKLAGEIAAMLKEQYPEIEPCRSVYFAFEQVELDDLTPREREQLAAQGNLGDE